MPLPKRPNYQEYEPAIYDLWEKEKLFTSQIDTNKEPFTILLPPPNANAPLHAGHALYVVEDILCRFHRMLGRPTLFLPGTDHAGIETQFVYEKHLQKDGKSRFDFDRDTLYENVHAFVEENRGVATAQLRRLGFSLDWSREKYTLSPEILAVVFDTFRKLHEDGYLYQAERLVNYCTHCGTGFSNLEIEYNEQTDLIYYLDYGTVTIATTRPETIFADVAVAVHPTHKLAKQTDAQKAMIPLINKEIPIITDELVDPEFGTGALKITPGHDHTDYEIGERHELKKISVINRAGNMINTPEKYLGMSIQEAREAVVEDLREAGKLVKEEPITHSVSTCYKCKHAIEPLLIPQWYITIKPLVEPVLEKIEQEKVQIFPDRFKKELIRWLETAPDWNISRQIVWGPRIPVWYDLDKNPLIELTFLDKQGNTITGTYEELQDKHDFSEISKGLQNLIAPIGSTYQLTDQPEGDSPNGHLLQETDTFDTWFSSGQWPLSTLGYPDSDEFSYFYPTSVLDTMWDILPFWVMRMLMLGVYRTGEVPFHWVHMHSRVVDQKGRKMSKSKGNVVNPMDIVDEYGADVLRMALVFGVAPASDVALSDEKMLGMRNFVTKLWNISRFILMGQEKNPEFFYDEASKFLQAGNLHLEEADRAIIEKLNTTIDTITQSLTTYQFSQASEAIYNFIWNDFANNYLESTKERSREDTAMLFTLRHVLTESIKLLHPFMPFVTEEIYQKLSDRSTEFLATTSWPTRYDLR